MLEIDLKISQIRPTVATPIETSGKPPDSSKTDAPSTPPPPNPPKERPPKEKPKNKAKERLETIQEEVLKAMERHEQNEKEGRTTPRPGQTKHTKPPPTQQKKKPETKQKPTKQTETQNT